MRVLLLGASGLVGGQVLQALLADVRCSQVLAVGRRPVPLQHAKLQGLVLEFDALPSRPGWANVDAVVCALGSTMAQAGTREAFMRIDHGYPLAFARLAREAGASAFVLNSATGADPGSRFFYNRVKGALEQDLRRLAFPSLTLVRPGLIGGERAHRRAGEYLAGKVLGAFGPLLPRAWRINPAGNIAMALTAAALAPAPGVHVVGAADLV